ncbi:MAG: hypothetical protein KAR54_00575 [Candidatus Pacebacteria bacterium]|nr:hypothetical protein [Candidatus Paceibacterota bacterium]
MSWSSRRKLKYQIIMVSIIVVATAVFLFSVFYSFPTCFDNIQNQDEEGIDCGGSCELICSFNIAEPIILWSRPIKTFDGVYSVIAMVENLNTSIEAQSVPYNFKLFDKDGILINEKKGDAFIPANSIFPIFEGSISTGNRIPTRSNFEFTKKPQWEENGSSTELISIKDIEFIEKNELPRVSAVIKNNSVKDISDIELIVLLFDNDNNLISSSKTILDTIRKNSSEPIIFTWPKLFDKEVSKIDIVPISKID